MIKCLSGCFIIRCISIFVLHCSIDTIYAVCIPGDWQRCGCSDSFLRKHDRLAHKHIIVALTRLKIEVSWLKWRGYRLSGFGKRLGADLWPLQEECGQCRRGCLVWREGKRAWRPLGSFCGEIVSSKPILPRGRFIRDERNWMFCHNMSNSYGTYFQNSWKTFIKSGQTRECKEKTNRSQYMIIKSANSYKLWWKKQKQVSILAAEAHLVTKKTGRIFERCSAAWEVVTKHFLQIQKKLMLIILL